MSTTGLPKSPCSYSPGQIRKRLAQSGGTHPQKRRLSLTAGMLLPRPCIDKIRVGAAEEGPTVLAFALVRGISISAWPVVVGAGSAGPGGFGPGNGTGGHLTPNRRLKVAWDSQYLTAQAVFP